MRFVTLMAFLLLPSCATMQTSTPPTEAVVLATLLDIHHVQFGCGVIHFGSPATYRVLKGPPELLRKKISVVVGCSEMPASMYRRYAGDRGDASDFLPGAIYQLSISKTNVHDIEVPAELSGDYSYFLKTASRP